MSSFTLDWLVIQNFLRIRVDGKIYRDNITLKEQLKVLYGEDTDECVQPIANNLTLELRLVHHFVCTNFTPKIRKYDMSLRKNCSFCGLILLILRLTCLCLYWTICSEPPWPKLSCLTVSFWPKFSNTSKLTWTTRRGEPQIH